MAQEHILVVEDTELLRRIYQDRLVQEGYTVHTASDGLEAIQQMRAVPVDLVLLDLIMPRMGGLEVLETMKADPRLADIPVVILTNLGEESSVERAVELGAVDYLIKNQAKPAEVAAKIRLVLDNLGGATAQTVSYKLAVRDRQADADRFVADARLPRRFWCPACEVELVVELIPQPDRPGWYDAHLICPMCGREF
ncbi:MAG: response regulator [Anaerosomatales bacterium]|nr:response regulator [Coriobacteriia bacterium]MDI6693001.1 response regulator [Anaerosomatales bacterium]